MRPTAPLASAERADARLHRMREGRGLFVFETCRQFIRRVPVPPPLRDPRDPDVVDTEAEDHVYDETRYRVTARRALGGERRVMGFW